MLLKRFYDDRLAQASFLVGCQATGGALVLDANRDAGQYITAAKAEGLRITHVTETHIHADFVSGSRELASRTGAELLLSAEGGADWQYGFAREADATLLHDGDSFMVGNLRFDVMHTPGHTPEHLTFIVTDTPATLRPMGAFTGDFIFVGDVGRPDLLERAAHLEGTMDASARQLFRSLRRFADQPDYLQLWPGHGAGSACGKSLGAVPQTTLGYERVVNWAFGIADEDEFVRAVLAGQPEPPAYFAEMKRINRDGPAILGAWPDPPTLDPASLADTLASGGVVVDLRPASAFAEGHVPGTLNIPLNRSFTNWAGSLLPYDADIYLIVPDGPGQSADAIRALAVIGLDQVRGVFPESAVLAWGRDGTLQQVPQVDAAALAARNGEVTVVDVRSQSEWDAGHIPGAVHLPLATLASHLDELPRDTPLVLQCQGGGRSSIASALLQANGFANVSNLRGGIRDWRGAGLPVDRDPEAVKA
ncbi:MAG TPA: rhodanese-like domain-containing protein [Gemmatimonadales bacterium]|jgi:hydroxyacylglutathione hydrolase|nr:rhodanese-like domain-containing protein [Gemmatimonadales bacterium]